MRVNGNVVFISVLVRWLDYEGWVMESEMMDWPLVHNVMTDWAAESVASALCVLRLPTAPASCCRYSWPTHCADSPRTSAPSPTSVAACALARSPPVDVSHPVTRFSVFTTGTRAFWKVKIGCLSRQECSQNRQDCCEERRT